MIGSHNTFSYLSPKGIWNKILTPWHKCQDVNIYSQYALGMRYFDIRVVFNEYDFNFSLVHNHVVYKKNAKDFLITILKNLNRYSSIEDPIYIRIIVDIRNKPCRIEAEYQRKCLYLLMSKIDDFSNIVIDDVRLYWDWHNPIISSKLGIKEFHVSVSGKWYQYLLGTKWFAKHFNKEYKNNTNTNSNVHLMDFINI